MSHKSTKKIKCKYCSYSNSRDNLIKHIEINHTDLLPLNYSADRIVYDWVNKKTGYGTCMVCKGKTDWSDKLGKYKKICNKQSCKDQLRKNANVGMLKVHNTISLLNDPDHQTKMLQNRSISGTYTWSDGTKLGYTGSYEKKFLEFMDNVLEVDSCDILAPGPVLEYEYNGEKHQWITDFLYIPYNLVIEIKDGGSNPNNRSMETYRDKQISKETMITDKGVYNYIRLPNNEFVYLLELFAQLRKDMIDYSVSNIKQLGFTSVRIHESDEFEDNDLRSIYIVNYLKKGIYDQYTVSLFPTCSTIVDLDGEANTPVSREEVTEPIRMVYRASMNKGRYHDVLQRIKDGRLDLKYLYNSATMGGELLTPDQLDYTDGIERLPLEVLSISGIQEMVKRNMEYQFNTAIKKNYSFDLLNESDVSEKYKLALTDNITIREDYNGYFAVNTKTNTRTKSYGNIKNIPEEEINFINTDRGILL